MSNVFNRTGGLKPGRSVFDLSYSKIFDCNAGELIPVLCDEMVPGDFFDISNECIVRLQPLVAPVLHEIKVTVHYFFVPYRLLWEGWEDFITGGKLGTDVSVIPRWVPATTQGKGSLWDYLGFPLVKPTGMDAPISMPARAYIMIWNEYYRDQTQEEEVPIIAGDTYDGSTYTRNWRKDYFTSALPWTQRGTTPALPVSGTTHAVWPSADFLDQGTTPSGNSYTGFKNTASADAKLHIGDTTGAGATAARDNAYVFFNANAVDLSAATTFTVNDLRLSIQVQKWMERNARAGVRYTEFLQEHFGVHPRDERLQRPEYIGGSKQPLIVSEVLKTSQDGSRPQGNLAGHGLSAAMTKVARYHAKEFGVVMGILSIMPEPVYASQGFDRQWLKRSRFDFYFPEFAHLSEQAIEREEIYATTVEADNRAIWGYQGRFDEMRVKRSQVNRNMRDTLNYWHMARTFGAAPALNAAFMNCVGTDTANTRIFAVPSEPGYLVHFGNKVFASRPLPYISEPGLMDHF